MSNFPNVRVFAFGLEKICDNLRLYKDSTHFHLEVNNYIIESIAKKKGLLTKENIDSYLELFDKKISQYRLPKEWNPMQKTKIQRKGNLSMEAARLLIESGSSSLVTSDLDALAQEKKEKKP